MPSFSWRTAQLQAYLRPPNWRARIRACCGSGSTAKLNACSTQPSGTSNLAMPTAASSPQQPGGAVHRSMAGGTPLSPDPRAYLPRGQLLHQLPCLAPSPPGFGCPPRAGGITFPVAGSALQFLEPAIMDRCDQGISEVPPQQVLGLTSSLCPLPGLFGAQPLRRGSQQALDLARPDAAFLDGTGLNTEPGGCLPPVTELTLASLLLAQALTGLAQP